MLKLAPKRLRLSSRDTDTLIAAACSQEPVSGLTHDFYKYPARFSPTFARAAIGAFTQPGDFIADPFMGGGTSLVEARVTGRSSIGSDISELAFFVAKTKTHILKKRDLGQLEEWSRLLSHVVKIRSDSECQPAKHPQHYFRNLATRKGWRIKKAISVSLRYADNLGDGVLINFARCSILRTAQWAIDGRRDYPKVSAFRDKLIETVAAMLDGASAYADTIRNTDRDNRLKTKPRTICINCDASKLSEYIDRNALPAPKLVITSPPYPGVHVLYHRWQIHGGRETPAPFWIANRLDGAGESYYTMGARREDDQKYYFSEIERTFAALRTRLSSESLIIQLVAFSNRDHHLKQYLSSMHQAGYQEYILSAHLDNDDGRLWREIPGRRWYANWKGKTNSAHEVVLIHKLH